MNATDTRNETTLETTIGPFRLVHWGDTAVLLETEHNQRHTVNRVDYHLRVDLDREAHGPWRVSHVYASRSDWDHNKSFNHNYNVSDAAHKTISTAALDAFNAFIFTHEGQQVWQYGYVASAEMKAGLLEREIRDLEATLKEKRAELATQNNVIRNAGNTARRLQEAHDASPDVMYGITA